MSAILAQARLRACQRWPFASHAILSMVPVERPGFGTLSVDQHWRLYFDESALAEMGTEEAAGVILHELDHLLKRHHKRGKFMVGEDASRWELWNFATDAAINAGLRSEGIPLPEGVVFPESVDQPEGLSAEEYFRNLIDQQEQADGQINNDSQTKDGEGDAQSDSATGSGTDTQGPNDSAAEGTPAGTDSGADCVEPMGGQDEVEPQPIGTSGSCSDGRQRPWELGPPDKDNPGLDEADQEQLIHTTAQNVVERSRGQGAGNHRRWAEQILDPPIDPASKLLNLVRRCCDVTVGFGERSYRRPSRRNSNPRMGLPSNVAPLPRITVIIDTSGSMGSSELGLALGMVRKVLQSFRIRDGIKVVTGDTKGQTQQLCLSDPRCIDLAGGGGTDMAEIVEQVLEDKPRPQLILVITDGWTPWPESDPGIPVVACVTGSAASLPAEYQPPGWIKTLELNGDRL